MVKLETLITQKFNKLNKYIVLIVTNSINYNEVEISVMKYLVTKKKIPGVYITVNKPFNALKNILNKYNINTEMIIFIDAISLSSIVNPEQHDHCFYLASPQDLSDISIATTSALESIKSKNKFVLIDSLSTLAEYNGPQTITKFIHFFISRIRSLKADTIILSLDRRSDKDMVDEVSQFCDLVVKV